MPVIGRLDWIQRQLQMGRRGYMCIGAARDAAKYKVKVHLEPASAGVIDPMVRDALSRMLAGVRAMVQDGVAMDRGHRHTSGMSEVSIWVSSSPPPAPPDAAAPQHPQLASTRAVNLGSCERSERSQKRPRRVSRIALTGPGALWVFQNCKRVIPVSPTMI